VGYVIDRQPNQVARAKFAVDGQVELREVALPIRKLQLDSDCADFAKLERWLLAGEFALVWAPAAPDVSRGGDALPRGKPSRYEASRITRGIRSNWIRSLKCRRRRE